MAKLNTHIVVKPSSPDYIAKYNWDISDTGGQPLLAVSTDNIFEICGVALFHVDSKTGQIVFTETFLEALSVQLTEHMKGKDK